MTTTTTTKQRTTTAPNFELTPRVIAINADIARYPHITTEQLRLRHQHIGLRSFYTILANLSANEFIYQPKQQNRYRRSVAGSLPAQHVPTALGVLLHNTFFADPVAVPKHAQATDPRTWNYMQHQMTTTSTVLDFERAAATVPGLRFIPQHELWTRHAPTTYRTTPVLNIENYDRLLAHSFITNKRDYQRPRSKKTPLRLTARFEWPIYVPGEEGLRSIELPMSTEPDQYFGQEYRSEQFFFDESDNDTETILPSHDTRHSMRLFYQSSLFGKYLSYIAAYRKRTHVKRFGIPSFKVLTETTSPLRVAWIIKQLQPVLLRAPLSIHPRFLLFTDRETLARCDFNPWHRNHFYKDLKGDDVHLLEL